MSNPRKLKVALTNLQFKDVFKNVSHNGGLFLKNKPGVPGAYMGAGPDNLSCPKISVY